MEDAAREIELLVRSRYPLIVVDTLEEDRLRALLGRTAANLGLHLFNWSRTRGLVRDGLDRGVYDTSDPLRLLAQLSVSDAPGLYLLADFHPYLTDPVIARTFREALETFTGDRRGLVLSGHGIDLPRSEDRKQILAMHLDRRRRDPDVFDLDALAEASDGFSGAELEQAIIAALYTAFSRERELDTEILRTEIESAVPLSRTMAERVQELRDWAVGRAVPAA